ncbi:hypothetical protein QJQ45_024671 [Haematococcus lacustris]|nr:hypothetical protein QJQ45_024671 [Haematococcus lacustris]
MEGAGVQITRTVGTSLLRNLDPYLMLDELRLPAKAAAAGFPDHPHRGFETCSIMLEVTDGRAEQPGKAGSAAALAAGGVQWMTAGRGIIHSEMPKVTDGVLHGFQLWINLPQKDKMCKPRYQDYQPPQEEALTALALPCPGPALAPPCQASDIPVVDRPEAGLTVRVMAGESYGAVGPIKMRNPGMLLDVRQVATKWAGGGKVGKWWQNGQVVAQRAGGGTAAESGRWAEVGCLANLARLGKGGSFRQLVPREWSGFVYCYEGAGNVSGTAAQPSQALVLGPGDHIEAQAGPGSLKFLLIAGQPIREPIVQHGPFVMNTQEEIMQAFRDFQTGRFQRAEDNPWADEL